MIVKKSADGIGYGRSLLAFVARVSLVTFLALLGQMIRDG